MKIQCDFDMDLTPPSPQETGDLPSSSLIWVHLVLMLSFLYSLALYFSFILHTTLSYVSMMRFPSLAWSDIVAIRPMWLFELNKILKLKISGPCLHWSHFKFSVATCASGYVLDRAGQNLFIITESSTGSHYFKPVVSLLVPLPEIDQSLDTGLY